MSLLFLDQQPAIEKIDCLSVDIGRGRLLVPMPAVAEIILNEGVDTSDKLPVWVSGWIAWRYLSIPIIDFRALQDGSKASDFGSRTRLLVTNSFAEGHSHHYYAIMMRGFPYTLSVEAGCEMTTQASNDNGKCIKIDLQSKGKKLLLPNFTEIETYLKQIPPYY